MSRFVRVILFISLATIFVFGKCSATQYCVRNLGTFGGIYAEGIGINESGEIVGNAQISSGVFSPFTWDEASGVRLLQALPGCARSQALAINDSREMAGYSFNPEDFRACMWQSNLSVKQLDAITGLQFSYAYAINNQGYAVGSCTSADWTKNMMVVWDSSGKVVTTVDTKSRGVVPQAITEQGCVAGTYGDASFTHAFIWDSINGFQDLGGVGSGACAMNDAGQVVGAFELSDGRGHAFIWDSVTGMRELGIPRDRSSNATGINSKGQVAGWYGNSAFVWDAVNGMQILEGCDAHACGINDRGQIVGFAGSDAVIWEPVPEPSSLAALLCGLVGVGGVVVRRRT